MNAPLKELDYPKVLTNADWQKKKGAIAKLVGKTGVGDALNAANKAYAKIEWKKFDVSQVPPPQLTVTNLTKFKSDAMAMYSKAVEPTRVELQKVVTVATKTLGDWKKKPVIPSSSVKELQDVINTATLFRAQLNGNSSVMSSFMKQIDRKLQEKERAAAEGRKNIANSIALLEQALKKVSANPTEHEWVQGGAWQACRGISNAVRNIDALKAKYWKDWQPLGDNHANYIKHGDGEQESVKKAIVAASKALSTLKPNYQRDMG